MWPFVKSSSVGQVRQEPLFGVCVSSSAVTDNAAFSVVDQLAMHYLITNLFISN